MEKYLVKRRLLQFPSDLRHVFPLKNPPNKSPTPFFPAIKAPSDLLHIVFQTGQVLEAPVHFLPRSFQVTNQSRVFDLRFLRKCGLGVFLQVLQSW